MLRKILALTCAICMATVLMSADARAWGYGGWSRSGSVSYTGRYGNTYTRSYSGYGGGYHYGGWGGYRYGAGVATVEGITAEDSVQDVSSRGTQPESIIPSTNLLVGPVNPYLRRK